MKNKLTLMLIEDEESTAAELRNYFDTLEDMALIENLQDMVQMYYSNFERVYIISILKRKDYKNMLKLLAEDTNAKFIVTTGNDIDRYTTSDELYECIKRLYSKSRGAIPRFNRERRVECIDYNNP